MLIYLNDILVDLPEALTLSHVITARNDIQGTFAIAVNNVFVPKGAYESTTLQQHDRIDVITPMQGG